MKGAEPAGGQILEGQERDGGFVLILQPQF